MEAMKRFCNSTMDGNAEMEVFLVRDSAMEALTVVSVLIFVPVCVQV